MGSSTGDLLVEDDASLDRIIARISRRAAFHSEDEARLKERMPACAAPAIPSSHPVWRDEQAALIATQRLVRLAEKHGKRVHVLHVSTAEEMAFLADHKDWASVEVTPHHLTLVAPDCYERLGTYAQMNPPVRDDRASPGASGRRSPTASSTCWAPTTRRTRARRRTTPIPPAIRA